MSKVPNHVDKWSKSQIIVLMGLLHEARRLMYQA